MTPQSSSAVHTVRDTCRACGARRLELFLPLGEVAPHDDVDVPRFVLERDERDARLHGGPPQPFHTGWRFSRKAPIPSTASQCIMFSISAAVPTW